MATAPVITTASIWGNSYVTIGFTHAGTSTEVFYLERDIKGARTPDWSVVRKFTRGTAVGIDDYTSAPADITYVYRFRVTNADGSGAVYSNVYDMIMFCKDYSSVSWNPINQANDLIMQYATSRSASRGRSTTIHKFAGRKDPAAEKAIQRSSEVDISWYVPTYTEVERFMETMLNADFWYRDNTGRSFHAVCSEIQESDSQVLNGWTLSAKITKIADVL